MLNPFTTQGVFSWYELMTTDVKAAQEFYGKVLGWTFETTNEHGMEYTLVKVGEDEVAGMFDRKYAQVENKEQIPPHWGSYITVNNLESCIEKVTTNGGNIIVPPTEIPKVGKFSVIQDPQGAVISLMEYDQSMLDSC